MIYRVSESISCYVCSSCDSHRSVIPEACQSTSRPLVMCPAAARGAQTIDYFFFFFSSTKSIELIGGNPFEFQEGLLICTSTWATGACNLFGGGGLSPAPIFVYGLLMTRDRQTSRFSRRRTVWIFVWRFFGKIREFRTDVVRNRMFHADGRGATTLITLTS